MLVIGIRGDGEQLPLVEQIVAGNADAQAPFHQGDADECVQAVGKPVRVGVVQVIIGLECILGPGHKEFEELDLSGEANAMMDDAGHGLAQ